jgi:hypothetical protein
MAVLISVTEGDVTQIVLADVGVQGATGPSSPASGTPFTPYGNIAATNVQTAIQELDDEKFGKAGGTVTGNLEIGTGGTLSFEGATADGFETTLAVVDPTADRTLTLPNVTGTFVTTGDTGTVTSTMLLDGTILNADVNASAAIAGTKISPDFGSQTIVTTGVHSAAGGSAAAPSITFTGDTDTGIYSPGANQVAISTSGTGRLFVDATGNIGAGTNDTANAFVTLTKQDASLRLNPVTGAASITAVQTGVAYRDLTIGSNETIFQTASLERMRLTSAGLLGLGTSSPSGQLEIFRTSTTDPSMRLRYNSSSYYGDHLMDGNGNYIIYSPAANGVTSGNLRLRAGGSFSISTNDQAASSPQLTLDSSGRLGIGDSGPDARLTIKASGGSTTPLNVKNSSGTEILSVFSTAGGGCQTSFKDSLGTTNILIDAANARVGIGTTSPGKTLEVNGNIGSSGRGNSFGYTLPDWRIYNSSSGGALVIDNYTTEALRVDSSNRLLVGTSTARVNYYNSAGIGSNFQVVGSAHAESSIILHNQAANEQGAYFHIGKSRGTAYQVVSNNDPLGVISFQGADGSTMREGAGIAAFVDGAPGASDLPTRLVFSTTADGAASPTERMRIDSNGLMTLAGPGIKFPATQVTSADANVLDDYEEGTFNISIIGGTFTDLNNGRYTKIGRQVFITTSFSTTLITGNLEISGLPFVAGVRSAGLTIAGPPPGITYVPLFVDASIAYVNVVGTYAGSAASSYFACTYAV